MVRVCGCRLHSKREVENEKKIDTKKKGAPTRINPRGSSDETGRDQSRAEDRAV